MTLKKVQELGLLYDDGAEAFLMPTYLYLFYFSNDVY